MEGEEEGKEFICEHAGRDGHGENDDDFDPAATADEEAACERHTAHGLQAKLAKLGATVARRLSETGRRAFARVPVAQRYGADRPQQFRREAPTAAGLCSFHHKLATKVIDHNDVVDRLFYDDVRARSKTRKQKEEEEYQHLTSLMQGRRRHEKSIDVAELSQRLYHEDTQARYLRNELRKEKKNRELEESYPAGPRFATVAEEKEHAEDFWHHQMEFVASKQARLLEQRQQNIDNDYLYLDENSVHRMVNVSLEDIYEHCDRLYSDGQVRSALLQQKQSEHLRHELQTLAETSLHRHLEPCRGLDNQVATWLYYVDTDGRRIRRQRRVKAQTKEHEDEIQACKEKSVHRKAQQRQWSKKDVDDMSERLFQGSRPELRLGPQRSRSATPARAGPGRVPRGVGRGRKAAGEVGGGSARTAGLSSSAGVASRGERPSGSTASSSSRRHQQEKSRTPSSQSSSAATGAASKRGEEQKSKGSKKSQDEVEQDLEREIEDLGAVIEEKRASAEAASQQLLKHLQEEEKKERKP